MLVSIIFQRFPASLFFHLRSYLAVLAFAVTLQVLFVRNDINSRDWLFLDWVHLWSSGRQGPDKPTNPCSISNRAASHPTFPRLTSNVIKASWPWGQPANSPWKQTINLARRCNGMISRQGRIYCCAGINRGRSCVTGRWPLSIH